MGDSAEGKKASLKTRTRRESPYRTLSSIGTLFTRHSANNEHLASVPDAFLNAVFTPH